MPLLADTERETGGEHSIQHVERTEGVKQRVMRHLLRAGHCFWGPINFADRLAAKITRGSAL
jgi:hypothetical protein